MRDIHIHVIQSYHYKRLLEPDCDFMAIVFGWHDSISL